jgi:type I restriction enzyme S subunit
MMNSIELGSQWRDVTLNDVCIKITDGAHLSPKSVEQGMPMASVKDLTAFGINIYSCRQIARDDYDKLVRQGCQPIEGDVLIAKDGASALDTVCVVKKTPDLVLLSSVAILRPDRAQIISSFLRYYLDSETTRSYMKGAFTTGAAIPRVVLKDFKLARIKLPKLPTQQKIAAILSAYDDLIENNLRRIKILEEMAQNLYREWFVKFRFPGNQYSRFIDSSLGRIPEGWEVVALDELVTTQYGYTESAQEKPIGPKYLRGMDINKTTYIDWAAVPYCPISAEQFPKYQLTKGDIVIIRMADPGKVGIVEKDVKAVFASYLVRLSRKSDRIKPYYLFHFLIGERYQGYITGASTGTTRKSASAGVLTGIEILIPPTPGLAKAQLGYFS